MKNWRLIDVLNWSKNFLEEKNIPSPQIEAEWMLRDVLGYSRMEIYMNHERPMSMDEREKFKVMLRERATGKPVQYILGYTEFMGLRFEVTPDVLIPRNDTEVLVEQVLKFLENNSSEEIKILDACTGSGCIAVSLAALNPKVKVLAVDISEKALTVAKKNSQLNNTNDRVKFQKVDILDENLPDMKFDVIVSNPPYVAGKYFEALSPGVKDFEPELALNPGSDELVFYRKLADIADKQLKPDGLLAVEIGGDYQSESVKSLFEDKSMKQIKVIKDYAQLDRVVLAEKQ